MTQDTENLCDVKLESTIIAEIIISTEFMEVLLAYGVKSDYFSDTRTKIAYFIASSLTEDGVQFDEFTFPDELRKRTMSSLPWVNKWSTEANKPLSDVVTMKWLMEIDEGNSVSMLQWQSWIQNLVELHSRRNMISRCKTLIKDLKYTEGVKAETIISKFETESLESDTCENLVRPASYGIDKMVESIHQCKESGGSDTGIKSGIDVIDRTVGHIQSGWFIVIGADMGSGKTILSTHFLINSVLTKNRCLYFALEMSEQEMTERIIGNHNSVNFKRVKDGFINDYAHKIQNGIKIFKDAPYSINSKTGLNIDVISAQIRRHKRAYPDLKNVFIDHMKRVRPTDPRDTNRYIVNGYISAVLSDLAKELNINIFLVCQHNNELRRKTITDDQYKSPTLGHIENGDTVCQDAHVVIQIGKKPESEEREICITKNRFGTTAKAFVNFEGQYTRFNNQ